MLQVYTGNGKGKTTAAIGLAIRSLGADKKVYFCQFMKTLAYSEQAILQKFAPQLKLTTSGKPYFIAKEGMLTDEEIKKWGNMLQVYPEGKPPKDYVKLVNDSLKNLLEEINNTHYDLIILDEINVAMYYDLITKETLEFVLNQIPSDIEIVCTGRYAPQWLCERADLVTDMQEVKHYYQQGLQADRLLMQLYNQLLQLFQGCLLRLALSAGQCTLLTSECP